MGPPGLFLVRLDNVAKKNLKNINNLNKVGMFASMVLVAPPITPSIIAASSSNPSSEQSFSVFIIVWRIKTCIFFDNKCRRLPPLPPSAIHPTPVKTWRDGFFWSRQLRSHLACHQSCLPGLASASKRTFCSLFWPTLFLSLKGLLLPI